MKKILLLLLFTIASYGQAVFDEGIQITGNANSATATKVNVQEANGKVNTQTINTGFNKNIGLGGSDVVGANTLLNQYSTTPVDWTATAFNSGQVVFYVGKQWIAKMATVAGDVPSVSSKWEEITFEALANKTTTVDQTIIDGSTNAVSSNAVFDGLALKNELIAHLKFNNADKTIWNNGYSNVTTATSYGEGAGRLALGSYWTANGFQAGYYNTTGSYWTANGFRAGVYLANGTSPLLKLNDGVFIGADTKALEDNSINEIVIGYNATGLGSNSSVIGNSSTLRSRIWGRFLSGTSVDDGVNQLQVAGTISASPATTANQVPTWGQVFDGLALKSNIGHTHVASQITDLSKASVGLGNVDNTSDLSKPLSTATINALATKFPTPTGLTTNYLPKWNGSGFGNSNIFDNGTNIGIGTTTPNHLFTVEGNNTSAVIGLYDRHYAGGNRNWALASNQYTYGDFHIKQSNALFGNPITAGTSRFVIATDGNVLIGTTSSNGVDRVQVAGTISASPATTANQVVVKSQLDAVGRPYKVYTAFYTQQGTANPSFTVLENTIGSVYWSRTGTGTFVATSSNLFTLNKTFITTLSGSTAFIINATTFSSSDVGLNFLSLTTGNLIDGVNTNKNFVEIRVYN